MDKELTLDRFWVQLVCFPHNCTWHHLISAKEDKSMHKNDRKEELDVGIFPKRRTEQLDVAFPVNSSYLGVRFDDAPYVQTFMTRCYQITKVSLPYQKRSGWQTVPSCSSYLSYFSGTYQPHAP